MTWKSLLLSAAMAASVGLLSSGGAAQGPAGPNASFVENECWSSSVAARRRTIARTRGGASAAPGLTSCWLRIAAATAKAISK